MAVCASGYNHCLFLDSLASVWSCGYNGYGGLGLGHFTTKLTPEKINNLPPIISISAGWQFSLFVDANGSVWSCGYNQFGQLGLGDVNHRNIPEQIKNLPKIKSALALGVSSLFLDCEGSVWSCGSNGNGQLGLGDTTHRNKAEKIQGLPAIKSMAGGGDLDFSMFVDEQGNVWVCGGNSHGVLGLGHTTQINSPQKNNNLSGIVAVAGGNANFSMFLDKQGNVFTCGNNGYGQLGLGDKKDRHTPQKVNDIPPMSSLSSCNTAGEYLQIVDCEGGVWSCGRNSYGQLGVGHTNDTLTFQQIAKLKGKEEAMQEGSVEEKKEEAEGSSVEEKEEEKEMFKSMEKQQSKELMLKMQSAKGIKQLDKHQLF